jgi:hypothetical protein
MTQRNRHLGPTTRRIGTLSMMLTVLLAAFALNALPAAAASLPWATFHDPAYGFSFSYPANWKLTVERDGSHPTLINAATSTTFSPIVNRQSAASSGLGAIGGRLRNAVRARTWSDWQAAGQTSAAGA